MCGIQMTLTQPWLCCLLLHIPQSIASVCYLLNMHLRLPAFLQQCQLKRARERNDEEIERKQHCQIQSSFALPSIFSLLLSLKKFVIVSHSLLISLFFLQTLSWAERTQLSSPQTGQDTVQLSRTWLNGNL